MAVLALVLLLLIATLGLAHVPRDTTLVMSKSPNHSMIPNPLPNPFPIPATDITLDFFVFPFSPQSPSSDIIDLFHLFQIQIEAHIRYHGNGPIQRYHYPRTYGKAVMSFTILTFHNASVDLFRYEDALAVIKGLRLKMETEGYTDTVAQVLRSVTLDVLASVAVQDFGDVKDIDAF